MYIYDLIKEFFIKSNIKINNLHLSNIDTHKYKIDKDVSFIENILVDLYNLNSELVKKVSKELSQIDIILGRNEKNLLKKFYDYHDFSYLNSILKKYSKEKENQIKNIIIKYQEDKRVDGIKKFKEQWIYAELENNQKKLKDYLYAIYSNLLPYANNYKFSTYSLFKENEEELRKQLSLSSYKLLEKFCKEQQQENNFNTIVNLFNNQYLKLLEMDYRKEVNNEELNEVETADLIYWEIKQDDLDMFHNKQDFYNYVLLTLKNNYQKLRNHKVLSIKVNNIYNNQENLKWDLFSKLILFGEHLIEKKETKPFYKYELLCEEELERYNIYLNKQQKEEIKKFYKTDKTNVEKVLSLFEKSEIEIVKKILYKYLTVNYGFTFTDCYILEKPHHFPNYKLPLIKNKNELLLIFYKNRFEDRKIPCPSCGSLKVSGNSYTEVGVKSWECKNVLCPDRSKSNRGKRFSLKSNMMQSGYLNSDKDTVIDKNFIKKWRKDITFIEDESEIIEMLVKYYTFPKEKVLLLNTKNEYPNIVYKLKRVGTALSQDKLSIKKLKVENLYPNWFSQSKFINNFIKQENDINEYDDSYYNFVDQLHLIKGNSIHKLQNIKPNSINSAVTSPPYYNARSYSTWSNLYLYLEDMYKIISLTYRVLKPGGVFLYNVGDVYDNPNIIAKSTMGKEKIPLGAYFVFLFEKAGFELLDNIIWDKGQPQSNRHKNDGKFTPHYQKPINSYEHMFIFKKPGKLNYNKQNTWDKNIQYIHPVIKINNKKENIYGHTAPFPSEISDFIANTFNQTANDIMLDPFSGSLTSVLSAYKSGIKGVGIELQKEYVDLSKKRCLDLGVNLKIWE